MIATGIAVVLLGFAAFLMTRKAASVKIPEPKVIIPMAGIQDNDTGKTTSGTTQTAESLYEDNIPLLPEELLISTFYTDYNNDSADDLIAAVKIRNENQITLIPMLFSINTQTFLRQTPVKTGITQPQTMSINAKDVIGEHIVSIVCTGMDQSNNQIMILLLPKTGETTTELSVIGDFKTDGSITINERERSEAYNLNQTNGISFSIVVQSSDPENPETLDQIQKTYTWNKDTGTYELSSEIKIPGKKIEAQYLQKLQSGSVADFEKFLNGLWYKVNTTNNSPTQYLLFDNNEKEIIFFDDNEEVYDWNNSSSIRYGLYISSNNKSITTLRRFITTRLTGIDEISIKLQEDVKLKIAVESDWSGTYRKITSGESSSGLLQKGTSASELLSPVLNSGNIWISNQGYSLELKKDSFSMETPEGIITGNLTLVTTGQHPVIQMRSSSGRDFTFFFIVHTVPATEGTPERKSLELIPARITAQGVEGAGGQRQFFSLNKKE